MARRLPRSAAAAVDLVLTDPPYGIGADTGIKPLAKGKRKRRYPGVPKKITMADGMQTVRQRMNWQPSDALEAAGKFAVIWGVLTISPTCYHKDGRWMFWDKLNLMPSYSDGEIAWTNLNGVVWQNEEVRSGTTLTKAVNVSCSTCPILRKGWC